jgi:hypothetical protein
LRPATESQLQLYIPIVIRFGTAENENQLMDRFAFHFDAAMQQAGCTQRDPNELPNTLWGRFKRVIAPQNAPIPTFILIFDQFEEFFSYPAAQQAAFKTQLAELLYSIYPQYVRENRRRFSADVLDWLREPLSVRVVFAIRSDKLSDLDTLSDALPAILKQRMELTALSIEQARRAIEAPAQLPNLPKAFKTDAFEYAPDALHRILEALAGRESKRIETFVLQIICFSIEKTIERTGLRCVQIEHLPDFEALFDTYYREQLLELPHNQQDTVALLLEYGLMYSDPKTGIAYRRSVDSHELMQLFGADAELLRLLEQTYLIRREINSLSRFSYEISHDTLIEPILKARRAKDAAAEAQIQAEAQLLLENQIKVAEARANKEKQLRIKAYLWTLIAILFAFTALLSGFSAYQARNEANQAREKAEKMLLKLEKRDFDELFQQAIVIFKGGYCLDSTKISEIQRMKQKYPMDSTLQQNIQKLQMKADSLNCVRF